MQIRGSRILGCTVPAALLAGLLALSGCSGAPIQARAPRARETPAPMLNRDLPHPTVPKPPPVTCPDPTVTVRTADELTAALRDADAGAVIQLAPGRYEGKFVTTADGRSDKPIFLCGPREAVLDGGGVRAGYGLHLDGANWFRVVGLTISNAQKGIMADATSSTVIQGVRVENIGDEGIHLRRASSGNVVRDNEISGTGKRRDKFGEGIYVGTAQSNWCTVNDCKPDPSNKNLILGNSISATTSEAVDIKEGTRDGWVVENRFDGSAMTGADSWVDVKGSHYLIADNIGSRSPLDGFQTHEIVPDSGTLNLFTRNNGSGLGRGGYLIALRPERANALRCDNQVTDSGELSNVPCR